MNFTRTIKRNFMKKLLVFLAFATISYLLSCTTDANASKSLNPNGDSELALLMRDMFDEGMRIKTLIEQGKKTDVAVAFEKIHSAQATDPEKMKTADFAPLADAYVQVVQQLKNAEGEQARTAYTGMVNACMNCHRSVCPGPMRRIEKMYLAK